MLKRMVIYIEFCKHNVKIVVFVFVTDTYLKKCKDDEMLFETIQAFKKGESIWSAASFPSYNFALLCNEFSEMSALNLFTMWHFV